MKKFVRAFTVTQETVVVVCMVIMSLSSLLQVLNRNIFKIPIAWTEELSRYCMIWMCMIGTGVSLRKGMQMAVDIWGKRFKGKLRFALSLFSGVMILVFCSIVMVSVTQLVSTQKASGQVSPALHIPMYLMSMAIFVGMFFLVITEIAQIYQIIKQEFNGEKEGQE